MDKFILDYGDVVNLLTSKRGEDSGMAFTIFEDYEDRGLYSKAKTNEEVESITLKEYDSKRNRK